MKKYLAIVLSCLMLITAVSCGTLKNTDPLLSETNGDTQNGASDQITNGTLNGSDNNDENKESDNTDEGKESDKTQNNGSEDDKSEGNKDPEGGDNENDKVEDGSQDDTSENKDTRKKITFGSYPQSEVTNATLKATLTSKAGTLPTKSNSQKWTSYKYYCKNSSGDTERDFMWYIDVTEGNEKYRGIYFSAYRPTYVLRSSNANTSYQDDNGYLINNVYWFKYEPISWTVLKENTADGTSLLLCDMILDSGEFDYDSPTSKPTYSNNYSASSVRKWLNETFLTTAFGTSEQAKIITSTVDNSALSTGYIENKNSCSNTSDKIFLLSYAEAVNDQYGLELSEFRIKKPTAYAKAQGIYTETDGTGEWWLRSPAPDPLVFDKSNMTVRGVTGTGKVDSYINGNYSYRGIVPALSVKLG